MVFSKKTFKRLLFVGLTLLLLFVGLSWYTAGRLVAPANRPIGNPPAELSAEDHRISSESGSELATWLVRTEGSQAVVILLHPIRSNRKSMLGRAKMLVRAGYSVVMIDFQAHGESPGDAITVGYREKHDVTAAVQFARKQFPGQKIAVIGWSMGGAAATLASPLDIDALVVESVYPSITEAIYNRVEMRLGPAKHIVAPVLLVQLKPRLGISAKDLRPIDHIAKVNCPVLVIGGDQDQHTTVAETKRMFEAAAEPKSLFIVDGANHRDFLKFAPRQYQQKVLGFLNQNLGDASD